MWICRHGLDTRVSHMKNSFYDIYLHSLGCQSLVLNTVFLLLVAIISPQEPRTLSNSLGRAQTRIVCSGSTRLVTTPEISPRRWSLFGRKREEMFRLRSRKLGAAWSRGMMTLQVGQQHGLRLLRLWQLLLLFLSCGDTAGMLWYNSHVDRTHNALKYMVICQLYFSPFYLYTLSLIYMVFYELIWIDMLIRGNESSFIADIVSSLVDLDIFRYI